MGKTKKPRASALSPAPPTAPMSSAHLPLPRMSSPFYPSAPPGPPVGHSSAPIPFPPPSVPKMPRKPRTVAFWATKLLVLVPALLAGLTNYLSAKDDAETSYKALVVVTGELQEAVQNLARQQIYLQGELDAARKRQGIKAPLKAISDFKSEISLSTLPVDLNSALKSQGKLTESRIIRLTPLPLPACP